MDGEDNRNVYQVEQMQQCLVKDGFGFEHTVTKPVKSEQTPWKFPIAISSAALMVVLVLIVILQSVTIAHFHLLPATCEVSNTVASSTVAGDDQGDVCNCSQAVIDNMNWL